MRIGNMKRTSAWRSAACSVVALFAVAHAGAGETPAVEQATVQKLRETAATRAWAWRLVAAEEPVTFHGVVSYDAAGGGAGAMLYPAPGPVGFLAALVTHAAINSGARSAEVKRIEEAADKVLLPLKERLDPLRLRDLQQAAQPRWESGGELRLIGADQSIDSAWVIETQPVFLMTQDRRAMAIEVIVRVFDGTSANKAVIERAVRVVSPPVKGDADAYWGHADQNRMAQTGAALLAEALRVAVLDLRSDADLSQSTVRYVEGGTDKFERAMSLGERCDRVALRTLRGGVMSVPTRSRRPTASEAATGIAVAADCGAAWPDVNGPEPKVATAPEAASASAAPTAPIDVPPSATAGEAVKSIQ